MLWPPNTCPLSLYFRGGENKLKITIYGNYFQAENSIAPLLSLNKKG
jgi:hypothetical protein